MAHEALNRNITTATPYTVPAAKELVFSAYFITGGTDGNAPVVIGGATVATLTSSAGTTFLVAKPLTAKAGDVISAPVASSAFGISGLLFDV